jgi:hypothetical protein
LAMGAVRLFEMGAALQREGSRSRCDSFPLGDPQCFCVAQGRTNGHGTDRCSA